MSNEIHQGDWVKIKYGEFMGKYGKVVKADSDGSVLAIPYNVDDDAQAAVTFAADCLEVIEPLVFGKDDLKTFCRGEKFYHDYADQVFPAFNICAKEDYTITADDIAEALRNINKTDKPLGLFKEWYWLIINVFYTNLHIAERFDEEFFTDYPLDEDELFNVVYSLTDKLYWRLEERISLKEEGDRYIVKFSNEIDWGKNEENDDLEMNAYRTVCEDIISRVDTYHINEKNPDGEHVYSLSEKRHMIGLLEDEEDLEKLSDEEMDRYRKFVFDLYEAGDTEAIKILAWGYYEGAAGFEQNWYLAEKYLKELLKQTGDPFAANSLGYIYYYGRTNFGVPDYVRAFSNFMFGAISGIDESIYKCADMLIAGKGTTKNVDMGINLIVDGYRDCLMRFCDGEYECKFADYALRMGNLCRDGLIYEMGTRDAYKFYLEAQLAIKKRREVTDYYGDDVVERKIENALNDIRYKYSIDTGVKVLKADYPIFINMMFEDRFPIKVTITSDEDTHTGMLRLQRFRFGEDLLDKDFLEDNSDILKLITPPPILTAYPELSWARLTTELVYGLENLTVAKKPDKEGFFLCDGFRRNEQANTLEFYANGELVSAIDTEWYVITKREK